MLMLPMRDGTGRTTSKDRATQLLICEPLSFAIPICSTVHAVCFTVHNQQMLSNRDATL